MQSSSLTIDCVLRDKAKRGGHCHRRRNKNTLEASIGDSAWVFATIFRPATVLVLRAAEAALEALVSQSAVLRCAIEPLTTFNVRGLRNV